MNVRPTGDNRIWWDDEPDIENLPLVLELRAEVARLQDQLRSATVTNVNARGRAAHSAGTAEKNSASGNVSAESETVTHLRRVIQVRTQNSALFKSNQIIYFRQHGKVKVSK